MRISRSTRDCARVVVVPILNKPPRALIQSISLLFRTKVNDHVHNIVQKVIEYILLSVQ